MSRRRAMLGAVGVACAIAGFIAMRSDGDDGALGSSRAGGGHRSSMARGGRAWPSRGAAQLAHPPLAATSVATEEQLRAAATQLSLSAHESSPSTAPLSPPALHAFSGDPRRAAALAQWQRRARSALRGCALDVDRRAAERETEREIEVEISVELVAAPRLQDGEWILWPRLAGVSLDGLRILAARYEPFALQACVQDALAIPLRVRLAEGEPAPRLTRALERLTVEL